MSDYDHVERSSLKLKKISTSTKNGIKKKKKHKRPAVEEVAIKDAINESKSNIQSGDEKQNNTSWMTEAQKKFLAQQEKRQLERVMAKASKSHKQRVEDFNTHLENLSEHYDIPKVSWTK